MSKIFEALQRAERTQETKKREERIYLPRLKRSGLDPFREAYPRLIQGINSIPDLNGGRIILVVSSVHGEGTSTVARNLAQWLARGKDRGVILVDANLRTPSQHLAFDVNRTRGLSDVAVGKVKGEDTLRQAVGSKFSLVPCGLAVDRPAQHLSTPTIKAFLDQLRQISSWVILDGPPVTLYPEACALAKLSDGCILVVRAESTRFEVSENARRRLGECNAKLIGAVLNRRRLHIPQRIYRRF